MFFFPLYILYSSHIEIYGCAWKRRGLPNGNFDRTINQPSNVGVSPKNQTIPWGMGTAVLENDGHTHTVLNGPPKSSLIFPHPYWYHILIVNTRHIVPSHPAPLSKNAWFSGASSSWRSGSVRATARSTSVPVAAAAGVWRRSWTTWDESWRSARWWIQATRLRTAARL